MPTPLRAGSQPVKTPTETPRARARVDSHINQLNPQGRDATYKGALNCGPAVVGMLARVNGKFGHLSEAALMRDLGHGLVGESGTNTNGIKTMLERANIPIRGPIMGAFDNAKIREHLSQGNKLVAQVGLYDATTKTTSPHYVLVRGVTHDGNYVVSDPMRDKPMIVTPAQLKAGMTAAGANGGLLIPVAGGQTPPKPGSAAPTATATATATATMDPAAAAAAPAPRVSRPPTQVEYRPFVFASPPLRSASAGSGSSSPRGEDRELHTSGLRSTTDEFRARDDGDSRSSRRDTSPNGFAFAQFERPAPRANGTMASNENRNQFVAHVTYSSGQQPATQQPRTTPVTPGHRSIKDYAEWMLRLKTVNPALANKVFNQLEASPFHKDKEVLKYIKKTDLWDNGGGSKTCTTGFGEN